MRRPESPTLVAALLVSGCTCVPRLPGRNAVRPPEQADLYYPRDATELGRQLDLLLAEARPYEGPVQAVIVPHAGLDWCGKVTARTLGALKGRKLRRIVIVAESHERALHGAALPAEGGLATPIGTSRIDEAAVRLLEGYAPFARRATAYDGEYVVEVLLPYLQRLWPEVPIVPVIVGINPLPVREGIGKTLRHVLDEETLLVASATFTHFGQKPDDVPFPLAVPQAEIERSLAQFEGPIVAALLERDPEAFEQAHAERRAHTCGFNAVAVALSAMGPGERGVAWSHGTSLERSFDPANPSGVSYQGLVFPGRWPPVAALDAEDRRTLGRIAEEGLAAAVAGRGAPELGELTPRLKQRGGAFVTLTLHGMLRGCMGRLDAQSIAQSVAAAAHLAASSDPRFAPLRPDDLSQIELEISVLGPFLEIGSGEEFEPGRHGLLLTSGFNRGLLLPQVATKYAMGRDEFLAALAEKAGLADGGWEGARLQRFGVEAFAPRGASAEA